MTTERSVQWKAMLAVALFVLVAGLLIAAQSAEQADAATGSGTAETSAAVYVAASAQVRADAADGPSRSLMPARTAASPPAGCTPTVWVPMLTGWMINVYKVSFCTTWFWLNNTRTGATWGEGSSGWFCQHAPSWAIWAVTLGKYRRC